MSVDYENHEEIKIFREYLKIPSVHPNVDYEPCLDFLKKQADSLNLKHQTIIARDPKTPILLMTWKGSNPELPAILLNSHMDVVPVFEEHWTHPPFGAEIHDGKIYARGSQDMKCVGTQYLGAIRALKKKGYTPERTFYISFVPEEETNSKGGMRDFIHTKDFKSLNIGFALDEAGASETEEFVLFFAERTICQIKFVIKGKPGHGLQLYTGTVGEKATYIMNKLNEHRKSEIEKIKGLPPHMPTVSAINLTQVEGGVQSNVIPPEISLTYDMRLAIDVDPEKWIEQIKKWCEEAGGGIEIVHHCKETRVPPTKMDESNEYYLKFTAALEEMGLKLFPIICPGATDARFVRSLGIPAFGFMPINNTPVLLHDHDEYIGVETYLKGIEIYENILVKLSS